MIREHFWRGNAHPFLIMPYAGSEKAVEDVCLN
jgi:hypothetical protein